MIKFIFHERFFKFQVIYVCIRGRYFHFKVIFGGTYRSKYAVSKKLILFTNLGKKYKDIYYNIFKTIHLKYIYANQ